jgi:hypothetical protein
MKNHFLIRQATNLIIGFSIVSLLLFSCKKDSDNEVPDDSGSYMISFKANGVIQEFTSDNFPEGAFYDNGTQYNGLFTGTRSSSKIGVEVYDKKAITETTYTGYAVTEATTQSLAYAVGAAISYQDGQTIYLTGFQNPDVTIKIIEITSTKVRGTFSGTLKANGKADIVITEGKFHVPIGSISA